MNSIENDIRPIPPESYPFLLRMALAGASNVPECLYVRGELPSDDHIFLTVVGSRRYTDYGKSVCEHLIAGLRGLPVVIISGLAYGIDSIAHEAAMKNGLKTIAVPGSGLAEDMIYPANHVGLARRILSAGGCLLSPFEETVMGNNWTFPYRNRIMAGMAHATLVIEAEEDSGTTITAEHAVGFNRDLLVVPGSILSKKSVGPHLYMKDGAIPIISQEALLEALRLSDAPRAKPDYKDLSTEERHIVAALFEPKTRDALLAAVRFDAQTTNSLLSRLELKNVICEESGLLRLV
ncbi:MAG TPA: DNA-protecting protein DprA [Candidatus Paceibacterota bacterium]|nr:DNA-protecting protein DprA [Candidatus Paceibacterota bacterium]